MLRVIAEAEALGIPWQEILSREVFAEGTLQRFLGPQVDDLPFWRFVSILPHTLFDSWRVRHLVDRLCFEASAEGSSAARKELATLLDCLSGVRARSVSREATLAKHSWFAYHRVLELQGIAMAAERISEPRGRRVTAVCEATGASRRDGEWAVARLTSPDRSHALDDAMAQARQEGFEIPRAETEVRAFARLRRYVSRHPMFRERSASRRRRSPRVSKLALDRG